LRFLKTRPEPENCVASEAKGESSLPEERLWQPVTVKWFAAIFGASVAYAIVRYHFAKGVAWNHFPLFILNKAVSLAAVLFIASCYLIGRVFRWHNHDPKLKLTVMKFCGLTGFSLASLHALFSMCLLGPAYYAKFFAEDGRLNVTGELGLAAGIVALWALAIPAISTLPMMPKAIGGIRWKRAQRMGYLCLALVTVHMLAFGLQGWFTPNLWPGNMPPISLLALIAACIPLLVKLWQLLRKRNSR
jgi:DMSO/TMAO reductase YedYZ heme-binding membrane subunit